ncbi:hypothetical protein NSTC745_04511 [Nostoc sp. DSM 114161]|jgi:hypothetical protein
MCVITVNDHLKNMCQIEHSRHRSVFNFLVNLMAGLAAYTYLPKNPRLIFTQKICLHYLLPFSTSVELTLHYALDLAWQQKCYKVMLLTSSKSEETLRFYERAGFKRGVKTGFIARPSEEL